MCCCCLFLYQNMPTLDAGDPAAIMLVMLTVFSSVFSAIALMFQIVSLLKVCKTPDGINQMRYHAHENESKTWRSAIIRHFELLQTFDFIHSLMGTIIPGLIGFAAWGFYLPDWIHMNVQQVSIVSRLCLSCLSLALIRIWYISDNRTPNMTFWRVLAYIPIALWVVMVGFDVVDLIHQGKERANGVPMCEWPCTPIILTIISTTGAVYVIFAWSRLVFRIIKTKASRPEFVTDVTVASLQLTSIVMMLTASILLGHLPAYTLADIKDKGFPAKELMSWDVIWRLFVLLFACYYILDAVGFVRGTYQSDCGAAEAMLEYQNRYVMTTTVDPHTDSRKSIVPETVEIAPLPALHQPPSQALPLLAPPSNP